MTLAIHGRSEFVAMSPFALAARTRAGKDKDNQGLAFRIAAEPG